MRLIIRLEASSVVMSRASLWTERGLFKGALGTVADILYQAEKRPHADLAVAIMMKFASYRGPCLPDAEVHPLTPVTRHLVVKGKSCRET